MRYADDFAVFAKSQRAAQRIMASVTRYLTDELRLVVNQEKSRVVTSEEFEFLGIITVGDFYERAAVEGSHIVFV